MAQYYIDSVGGNDSTGNGTFATPWATTGKLITHGYAAGDTINLKCNGTYDPFTITVAGTAGNKINWQSYSTGNIPTINGFFTIPSWTNEGGGIYSYTNVSLGSVINTLTLNGVSTAYGRMPTSGWYTYSAHSGTSSITDAARTAGTFAGAEVVIRKDHFTITRGVVSSIAAGGVINYTTGATPGATPTNGFGYFFQNHSSCLTQLGDWYYDATNHKLYVYFGGGGTGGYTVQVTNADACVTCTSPRNYHIFTNINFTGGNRFGYNGDYGSTGVEFHSCSFSFNGVRGIYIGGAINATIDGCIAQYHCNNAFYLSDASGCTITNNIIQNTGIMGMGQSDTSAGSGGSDHLGAYMALGAGKWNLSTDNTIQFNTITNTLYNGITSNGDNLLIDSNYVDTCCTGLDDGAGIYVGGQLNTAHTFAGRVISNNIIINSTGATSGTNGSTNQGNGIYLDDSSSEVTLTDNFVANCGQHGYFLHNNKNITFTNNTGYNNGISQLCIGHDNIATILPTGFVITDNVLVANTSGQLCFNFYSTNSSNSTSGDFTGFGTCNTNNYWSLSANTSVFQTQLYGNSAVLRTFASWKTLTTKDAASTYANPVFLSTRADYNGTASVVPISLSGIWNDIIGSSYSSSYNLGGYSGQVLIQVSVAGSISVRGLKIGFS